MLELRREKAVMANLTTAYILWFFFGLFGLHHFYLKRDRHAFLWWSTLGGFCFGWIRDSWRLPEYVEQANKEKTRVVNQNNRRHKAAEVKPNLSLVRQIGMTLMAYFLGYLVQAAWPPKEIISIPVFNSVIVESADSAAIRVFHIVLTPLAVAIGVHLVASIGSVQASFQMSLAGAYLGILWMLYTKDPSNIGACCLISTALTKRYGLCKKAEVHAGKCRRISILFLCGTVYLLLWTSTLYFNVKITTKDGEEVPLREATNNFFKSPAWKQTKESLNILWQHIKVNGWRSILKEILDAIDPQGEANALKVLGLDKTSSQEDIKKQYKMLAKEWHPDRHKDPEKKAVAQEKFMEIQEAYEILSKLKTSRSKQNKKSTTEKEEL